MNDKNYIFYRKIYSFFILLTLTFLIYSNTFNASWHLDDYPNIIDNSNLHIKNLQLKSIYKTFFGRPGTISDSLYRPVSCLTFALNWYFDNKNVTGYHIVNIAIHFSTASILFLTILSLLGSPNLKNKFRNSQYPIAFLSAAFWDDQSNPNPGGDLYCAADVVSGRHVLYSRHLLIHKRERQ